MRRFSRCLILVVSLLLLACARPVASPEVRGQIILWHAWDGSRAETLNASIDRFVEIYPDAIILRSSVPADQLVDRYRIRAAMGLGPDLLIMPGGELGPLAADELIQDLTPYAPDTTALYASALVRTRYEDRLYGLPLALDTMVLYYNREEVATPARTLDELLTEASAGHGLAMPIDFHRSFWGIKAFGGELIDQEGRIILDQGGFANWLAWLRIAQENERVFLTSDPLAARQLFETGRVSYYVGSSRELPLLRESLGMDLVGAAQLPAGPFRQAGPLLESQVMVLNASSSERQSELALRLAQFLTGVEQQTRLARETSTIPANAQVRVDPRLNPATAAFLAQIQSAVPVPNLPQVRAVLEQGDSAYTLALEGVLTVSEAAAQLSAEINEAYGLGDGEEADIVCELEGTLRIWHTWHGSSLAALGQASRMFMRACPGVYVVSKELKPAELPMMYVDAVADGRAPDLVLGPSEWIASLAAQELLSPLDAYTQDLDQRFLPAAWQAARLNGRLYGLPVSLRLTALYYDAERVAYPPPTLDDLLREAQEGQGIALLAEMPWVLWGAAAFGGSATNTQQQPVWDADGLAGWLDWLYRASNTPGVWVSSDADAIIPRFVEDEVAYLVADSSLLPDLRAELGRERLRAAPLPAGPDGESLAPLSADVLLFNPNVSAERRELALAFGLHLTSVEVQQMLMEQAARVPANVNVTTANDPVIAGLLEQANSVVVPRSHNGEQLPWQQGAVLLERWLEGDTDLIEELRSFVDMINGRTPTAPVPTPAADQDGMEE
jgi:arabinogalactan oligomer / maltooligosaccharide transport system substrate-binding protein